ncbi:Uncharacterised protein [Acinetobacter phage MD-2021a]|nr:Uncharacterised protein [Acinetobacter phage MD-2021a]CAH1089075.1 Uncharacterised protein [Acinetobacter phage MD-2021a]
MHFREVNKKLKQLKSEVMWCSKALSFTNVSEELYQKRVRAFFQAKKDLETFRNTTLKELVTCTV